MTPKRVRADLLLVERGLAPTRARAQAHILAGEVHTGELRIDKAGQTLAVDAPLELTPRRRFVSRGGDKLDRALTAFGEGWSNLAGRSAVDVGSSTGGFTDCLLQRGAEAVVAVDVGFGQLDPKLRADPRVDVRERTNARDLTAGALTRRVDLVVVDASFIGLGKLLPAIASMLEQGGDLVALVKPQFEAGRQAVTRGRGVIRDPEVRDAAIEQAREALAAHGFTIVDEVDSELRGPRGNLERFVWARLTGADAPG